MQLETPLPATTALVLVGHGAVAKDCPRDLVRQLKALEGRRQTTGTPPTPEEKALEDRIRRWPRTPANDPYGAGCEQLIHFLRPLLPEMTLKLAYLEFSAPTLDEVVADLWQTGVTTVLVVPSMMTPGGVHSEVDIPQIVDQLQTSYPEMTLRYAWPFDLTRIAQLMADHVQQFA
jgi:sirohydrochlorin cobaltochelatase